MVKTHPYLHKSYLSVLSVLWWNKNDLQLENDINLSLNENKDGEFFISLVKLFQSNTVEFIKDCWKSTFLHY